MPGRLRTGRHGRCCEAPAGRRGRRGGRFATAGFVADVDEVRMDGDVTTGFLGADVARARWLAGVLARAFELPLLGRLARMEDVRAHAGNAVGKTPGRVRPAEGRHRASGRAGGEARGALAAADTVTGHAASVCSLLHLSLSRYAAPSRLGCLYRVSGRPPLPKSGTAAAARPNSPAVCCLSNIKPDCGRHSTPAD